MTDCPVAALRFHAEGPLRFHAGGPLRFHAEGPLRFHTEGPPRFHAEGPLHFHAEGPLRRHEATAGTRLTLSHIILHLQKTVPLTSFVTEGTFRSITAVLIQIPLF
jgi:hypothetical protein